MNSEIITNNILNTLLQQFTNLLNGNNTLQNTEIYNITNAIFQEIIDSHLITIDINSDYTIKWNQKYLDENGEEHEISYELIFLSTQIKDMIEKKKMRDVIRHLPKYKKIKADDNLLNNQTICSICYEDYKLNEFKRELHMCKHIFHKKCIDKWFLKNSKLECPICRHSYGECINTD